MMQCSDGAEIWRATGTRHHRRPEFLTGAEPPALAGQQQRTAGMIRHRCIQRVQQRGQHRLVRSVQLLWPIQYKLAPAITQFDTDLVTHACLRHSDHDTRPSSGRGDSSSMEMNSSE